MADLIELIQSRQSTPLLKAPSPSEQEWQRVIETACCAPDHGRLRPWQFRLIEGDNLKKLGEVFITAQTKALADEGQLPTEQQINRTKGLPLRAPAILAVVATLQEEHKIPVIEQISAVAAATQNIQLALHSLGYGCIWRTGDFAFYDDVKKSLGFEASDEIIGFLYVGTPEKAPATRTLQPLESCFQHWQG